MTRRVGTLFGPAGSGKDTALLRLSEDPGFGRIVNDTTRLPRPGEEQDVAYHFVSKEQYERARKIGAYITAAEAHGRNYAVRKQELQTAWNKGSIPIGHFGIEDHRSLWALSDEGAFSVRSILLMTRDFATWEGRMKTRLERGFISHQEVFVRASAAVEELVFAISNPDRFAHVVSDNIPTMTENIRRNILADQVEPCPADAISPILEDFNLFLKVNGETA